MKSQHFATTNQISPETFASSYQWMLPPIPVLDEEFDEAEMEEQEAGTFYSFKKHAGPSN